MKDRKRYKDTKYAETEVLSYETTGCCAIAACSQKSEHHLFVTIRGRSESIFVCANHFNSEAQAENMYRLGL